MIQTAFVRVLEVAGLASLGYFCLLNLYYLVTSLLAYRALSLHARVLKAVDLETLVSSARAPAVTLLLPSYNEEATCVESVRSLLSLVYPRYELMVVNDGSKDATLERLVRAFEMVRTERGPMAELRTAPVRAIYRSAIHPNVWVIDKENGGKSDALNAGLRYCRTPFFCAMDADTLLERDALTRIIRPFLEDRTTVAVGGIVRIVNDCTVRSGVVSDVRIPRSWLARFQVLEYLRAFLAGRMAWAALDATLIISGAFGMFRRSSVVEAGGYATDTVGEDMELVVRLHRRCREKRIPYRMTFVPDPVAWTECPQTVLQLARQRDRWQRGLCECLSRHLRMLGNPRYGRIGLLAFPYFFLFEMLGAVLELVGYLTLPFAWWAGAVDVQFVLTFLLLAIVFGIALSIAAVGLEELSYRRYPRFSDLPRLFLVGVIENFGYRQLVTWYRFRGLWSFLRGVRGWGTMIRVGFAGERKAG